MRQCEAWYPDGKSEILLYKSPDLWENVAMEVVKYLQQMLKKWC